jgi:D-methionine transport system ATP-binding protein
MGASDNSPGTFFERCHAHRGLQSLTQQSKLMHEISRLMILNPSKPPQICLEHVSFASRGVASSKKPGTRSQIGAHYLLQDLSFEVVRGERIAIVGASGSGKTTLLRLLNRLNEPTQGSLYLEGQNFRQIPVLQLRQQITLVQQESKLLNMTVREALLYPLRLRDVNPTAAEQQVSKWVEQLHVPQDWLDRNELQLSVGQRQLVAIARALVIQPKVLLLDEPTSALDSGRSDHVLNVLKDLPEITILMANHQLDLAQSFSDRVLHLHRGELVQNERSDRVDWQTLKATIRQSEAKESAEWE